MALDCNIGNVGHLRLQKTLEYITDHPEKWDQGIWIGETECGTIGCLAGWGAMLTGWQPHNHMPIPDDDEWETPFVVNDEGVVREAIDVATEAFGLKPCDADTLFEATNDLNQLWKLAEIFTDGAVQRPRPAEV